LRYDIFAPLVDKTSQRWTRFNAATQTLEIAGTSANPRRDVNRPDRSFYGNVYPALIKASAGIKQADLGKNDMWDTPYLDFGPRVGFAYRLSNKMVWRGGYGVFKEMNQTGAGGPQGIGNNFPFVITELINTTPSNPNFFFSGDPFVNATAGTISLSSVDPHMRTPYVQNWNLGVERELVPNLLLDVSYVGSMSSKLLSARDINEPYSDGDPNPINSRRPIQGLGSISQVENSASANFHSLQAKVEKRFSAGLQFTTAYLWGHSIDNDSGINGNGSTNGFQSSWNLRNNRGRSTFDVRQRLVISHIYEIPVGRGRHFLGGVNKIADALIGGWQFGGITTFQSGNPLTITVSGSNSNVGATDRANVVPGVDPVLKNHSPQEFFNVAAFSIPPKYHWGNAGRNTIDGPGVQLCDLSLDKTFRFTENHRVQFRAEFFNILNHPNFFPPVTDMNNPNFGKIQSTGSYTSRQIQLALKLYY